MNNYVYLVTLQSNYHPELEFLEGVFPSVDAANEYIARNPAPENYSYHVYAVRDYLNP